MSNAPCLHCAIRDAIADHFEAVGSCHGDNVVIQLDHALDGLVAVTGELLAGVPDNDQRNRIFSRFIDKVVRRTNEVIEQGDQPDLVLTH